MDDRFKVCGNCCHCTMIGNEYVCIDPAKARQEVVTAGSRQPCFVVTALTPEQTTAAALTQVISKAIH